MCSGNTTTYACCGKQKIKYFFKCEVYEHVNNGTYPMPHVLLGKQRTIDTLCQKCARTREEQEAQAAEEWQEEETRAKALLEYWNGERSSPLTNSELRGRNIRLYQAGQRLHFYPSPTDWRLLEIRRMMDHILQNECGNHTFGMPLLQDREDLLDTMLRLQDDHDHGRRDLTAIELRSMNVKAIGEFIQSVHMVHNIGDYVRLRCHREWMEGKRLHPHSIEDIPAVRAMLGDFSDDIAGLREDVQQMLDLQQEIDLHPRPLTEKDRLLDWYLLITAH